MTPNTTITNGLYPPDYGLNSACERAWKICEKDPTKRIIYDIESMWPIVVSVEEYEKYLQMWDDLKPKIPLNYKPALFFYGTAGQVDKNSDFRDVFYNNKDEH